MDTYTIPVLTDEEYGELERFIQIALDIDLTAGKIEKFPYGTFREHIDGLIQEAFRLGMYHAKLSNIRNSGSE